MLEMQIVKIIVLYICYFRLETNCSVEFRSQVHEDKVQIFWESHKKITAFLSPRRQGKIEELIQEVKVQRYKQLLKQPDQHPNKDLDNPLPPKLRLSLLRTTLPLLLMATQLLKSTSPTTSFSCPKVNSKTNPLAVASHPTTSELPPHPQLP